MKNEAIEMDEIEEVHHQQENRDHAFNDDVSDSEDDNSSSGSTKNMTHGGHEVIEVDDAASSIAETEERQGSDNKRTAEENVGDEDVISVEDGDDDEGTQDEVVSSEDDEVVSEKTVADENGHAPSDEDSEVHEIIYDYEYQDVNSVNNGYKNDEMIEIINSEENDEEGDEVMIIDYETPKEDGRIEKRRRNSKLDTALIKKKIERSANRDTPRQNVKNLSKETKSYKQDEDEKPVRYSHRSSKESYTEEIAAENPVAFNIGELEVRERPALTDIPQTLSPTPAKLTPSTSTIASSLPSTSPTSMTESPELTDSMFVVEAASLFVSYLNQKPPGTEFKTFLKDIYNEILKQAGEQQKKETEQRNGDDNDDAMEIDDGEKVHLKNSNFVEECVQSNLLSQQKRKLDRERRNPDTSKTIQSLLKNLEYSKEYNEHFKRPLKKCEYCNFKTESFLVLANHLETPHTKNGMYKCNFCPYEIQSPHDILSHMKAEHGVRGRLEPVPAFCKSPNINHKSEASSMTIMGNTMIDRTLNMVDKQTMAGGSVSAATNYHLTGNQVDQQQSQRNNVHQPSSSMIQPTRPSATPSADMTSAEPSDMNSKNLDLRWIHQNDKVLKTKIIFACQLCQSICYTEQDLEHHLLGSHGLVFSSMQDAFSNSNDADVCPVCEDYHFKLLNHVALDHGMTLKPVNLSYECTICAATFGVYNQLKHHMYSAHILVAKQAMNKKFPLAAKSVGHSLLKPLSINDEITLIRVPVRTSISEVDSLATPRDVKYPEMPYSCQKCKCRFVTNQDLECHLLGSHGLVTSRMQDAADKNKDFGICNLCGVYQLKLLNHVAHDHLVTLKPAQCTCHIAACEPFHSQRRDEASYAQKGTPSAAKSAGDSFMEPVKINDEISITLSPAKASTSIEDSSPTHRGSVGTSKSG